MIICHHYQMPVLMFLTNPMLLAQEIHLEMEGHSMYPLDRWVEVRECGTDRSSLVDILTQSEDHQGKRTRPHLKPGKILVAVVNLWLSYVLTDWLLEDLEMSDLFIFSYILTWFSFDSHFSMLTVLVFLVYYMIFLFDLLFVLVYHFIMLTSGIYVHRYRCINIDIFYIIYFILCYLYYLHYILYICYISVCMLQVLCSGVV